MYIVIRFTPYFCIPLYQIHSHTNNRTQTQVQMLWLPLVLCPSLWCLPKVWHIGCNQTVISCLTHNLHIIAVEVTRPLSSFSVSSVSTSEISWTWNYTLIHLYCIIPALICAPPPPPPPVWVVVCQVEGEEKGVISSPIQILCQPPAPSRFVYQCAWVCSCVCIQFACVIERWLSRWNIEISCYGVRSVLKRWHVDYYSIQLHQICTIPKWYYTSLSSRVIYPFKWTFISHVVKWGLGGALFWDVYQALKGFIL